MFRRLADLRSLGLEVWLIPIESQIEGGAAAAIASIHVRLEPGPREPALSRLRSLLGINETLLLTDLAHPRSLLAAATEFSGTLVLDLDHLPSAQRSASRAAFRPSEMDGLDTEIEHLRQRERAVLERADLVICNSTDTALDVERLLGRSPTVVPPTVEPSPGGSPTGDIVLPGRFTDEFATPDEQAIEDALCMPDAPRWASTALITPEDTVPRLRVLASKYPHIAELRDSAPATASALAAIDVRSYGLPTRARRAELMALGVPFVASPTAVGQDDLSDLRDHLVASDPTDQADLLRRLRSDPGHRDEVRARLVEMAHGLAPSATRLLLADAFRAASIPVSESFLHATDPVTRSSMSLYRTSRTDGTLAAADRRVDQLEREMVPLRLLSRDDSINLQSTLDPDQRYRVFSRTHLETPPATAPSAGRSADGMVFSVIVPVWNTDPVLLRACIDSVRSQTHSQWQLCLVDDGSTETAHRQVLLTSAEQDDRIQVQINLYNQGIALASNDALAMADGDWIVLLDHDDVLKPDALAWAAAYIAQCPEYDVWYSDEDKIDLEGNLAHPFFKPDWSPDLLLGVNYVCHMLVARHELVREVGGFRAGFDGAQDYDLVLRLTERARRVGHIAKPLYSWRMIAGSTALDTGSKPKAHTAGHDALSEALARRFEPAEVEDGLYDTTHAVHHIVDTDQLVTILIPTRDRVDLLRGCIERLDQCKAGVRYEILVVDNQSKDPETLGYLDDLAAQGHQVVRYPHEFSFARQINLGALHARGDLLLILNNDATPRTRDWLPRMMEHAQRPEVGLVGARLMFPPDQRGGRPQHEGIVMGMAGLAYNIDLGGYMGMDQFVRNCSSVTAACVMLRLSVFFAVGGMEERLRVAYNDVDFGLRVSEFGYRVVYTPHAVLEHPESTSRKDLHPAEDEEWLIHRWGPKGSVREPFVNTHFEWLMPVYYRL